MKSIVKTLFLFGFFIICITGGTYAQVRKIAFRERIANAKLNEIGKRMNLNKVQIDKLRPVYLKYEKEKASLFAEDRKENNVFNPDSITDDQAERIHLIQFDKARKMIDLREKYYHEFRKTLTTKQIIMFHRIEMEVNHKIMQSIKNRMNTGFPEK